MAFGAEAFPKISTGTDLVISSSRMMTTTGGDSGVDVQPMSPMDTMREVFFDIRDSLQTIVANTLQTNELLKVGILGTPADQRRESIERAETDSQGNLPPNETNEGGPSFLDRLKGLNPFQSGIGTFGKVLLAIAGLLGLKLFGPQIQGGLASLLQLIADGKITEKVGEIVTSIKEKVEPAILKLKENFALFLEGVTKVKDIIVGLYTSITDYINKFDTDGIEGLSEEELNNLKKDVISQTYDIIMGVFGKVIENIGASFKLLTIASIATFFARMAPGAAAGAGLGVLGTLGLVAFAAAGVYSLYDRIMFALNDELDNAKVPDNIIDKTSNFLARFLGGKDSEGGITNALNNAGTFGLIGAVLGSVVPGVGTAAGFAIGSALGLAFGYVGSDELLKDLPSMKNFDENSDKLYKFFTGRPTLKEGDEEALTVELNELIKANEINKQQKAEREAENKSTGFLDTLIERNNKAIIEKKQQIKNAPVAFADRQSGGEISAIDDQIDATQKFINEMKKNMLTGGQVIDTPGGQITLDPPSQADIDAQLIIIQELEKKRLDLILLYEKFKQGELNSNAPGGFPTGSLKGRINTIMDMKQPNAMGGAAVVQQNVDNSTALSSSNVYTHPLAANNSYLTAMMAHRNKLMMG